MKIEAITRDAGSFRDPSGYVFDDGSQIIRSVNAGAAPEYVNLRQSGLLEDLRSRKLVLPAVELPPSQVNPQHFSGPRGEVPQFLLSHPRIPFISYPYEWGFEQLRDAALAHLEIQCIAFRRGYVLTDATPYNMQFYGDEILHIDLLSFRRYRANEYWLAYNQFCQQFLNPLLVEAWKGLPFQSLMRGRLEGISVADAQALLPWSKRWLSLNGFMHVEMHARLLSKVSAISTKAQNTSSLPANRYLALLENMQNWISRLKSARSKGTYWKQYSKINSYSDATRTLKLDFVRSWAAATRPKIVWDVGGNTGDFSLAALEGGAKTSIILDVDLDCIELAYQRRKNEKIAVLPVLVDLADPSPSLGWAQAERKGLFERAKADGIIALALIHHLAIGRNMPLAEVVSYLISLAPHGIIEFVPKSDPMVRQMLVGRDDMFDDYDVDNFKKTIASLAHVTKCLALGESGRILFAFERK